MPSRCSQITAGLLGAASAFALLPDIRGQDAPFKRVEHGPVDLHTQKTLYVVPYAHLDTQWRWAYPQTIREFLADTLHKNFALFDKYPNYVFNFSGSRRYEMMHEYFPEDWERLKGYIKEGRWFPCGSSVDEDDANVPNLESMVRHVLYGNHYFRREFGVASDEFMLPDCFGFPACLPTILTHCGIKGFSTQKLTWGSAVGIPFKIGNWVGPDGSVLAAALDPGGYGSNIKEDMSQNSSWLARIDKNGAESGIFADYKYYGTGDRGGSPQEDSVRWMERSVAGTGPMRVVSANAQQMFLDLPADAREKLPRYKGELLLTEHSAGSITSQAYMKRWNRKNEMLADAAERAAVAANWLGGASYPTKKIYDSWDLALGTQMHDMLPGTSLPKAYEYCWNDYILASNGFAAVAQDSVAAVTAALDTQTQGGAALVVYNPLSIARTDVVEGSLPAPDGTRAVQVTGPDGKELPAQVTSSAEGKVNFIFVATVPSVSFTTFDARVLASDAAAKGASPVQVTEKTLENERYKVALNAGGDVASIFDKTAKRELLSAPMRLEFHQENPAQFPAWNMDWADRQKPARGYVDGPATIKIVEVGPVRATLEVERRAEGSRFVSRISLAAGGAGDSVEFHDKIDWGTHEACLKAALPLTVSNPVAAYDDKVGVVMRGNNNPKKYEVPQHEWIDLTDQKGEYGVSFLNDSKFGSDKPDDHTVRLTLLYSPGVKGDYQDQATQDFGRHDIAYAVSGHPGGWQEAGVTPRAHRLNQPLRAFITSSHPGALGKSLSFASLDNSQVEITAIKKAEDSDETIVRLRELGGQTAQPVRLKFAAPILAIRELDGQERALDRVASPAELRDGQVSAQVIPYGLRTFALKLGAPAATVARTTTAPVTLPFDEDVISTRAKRTDGDFDHTGRSFPAETLPPSIVSEGIPFQMGPTADGQKNALACKGQPLPLPEGDYDRVVLLAASSAGDKAVSFQAMPGGDKLQVKVQDWTGYVGQWDNRLWKGDVPELTYSWNNALDGLVPGFVKPATVVWYSSHRSTPAGYDYYQYCYLFKYTIDVPKGAKSLTLPNDPAVRIFAATMAKNGYPDVQPAQPLFDTLADHQPEGLVTFQPAGGKFSDGIVVKAQHPLYFHEGGLRYTLDGSEPKVDSARWTGELALNGSAILKARMYLPGSTVGGMVTTVQYDVDDKTPPKVRSANVTTLAPELCAEFSEAVTKESAENVGNYRFEPEGATIRSARLGEDGKTVTLSLGGSFNAGFDRRLVVNGVRDRSPNGNPAAQTSIPVVLSKPVYYQEDTIVCNGQQSREIQTPGLPSGAKDSWTINCFVQTDVQPGNRTLIAGFGSVSEKGDSGKGRYISKFGNGLHFWSNDCDGDTSTPLDLNRWQMLSVTYDGASLKIYKDGVEAGQAALAFVGDDSVVQIAPLDPWDGQRRFKGKISRFSIWKEAMPPAALAILLKNAPKVN